MSAPTATSVAPTASFVVHAFEERRIEEGCWAPPSTSSAAARDAPASSGARSAPRDGILNFDFDADEARDEARDVFARDVFARTSL